MRNFATTPFFILITLYFSYNLQAQTPSIQWQTSLGGSDRDEAYSIRPTADGGYIVAGTSYSTDGDVSGNHGGSDYWVVKLNASGTIMWQKSLGGSNNENANSIQQTADGGYIVAGHSLSNDGDVSGNHGNGDYWVVKLDANGNITWQKSLGGSIVDVANSIQQSNDGGYIVAGYSLSFDGDLTSNHGNNDCWVVKLDTAGNISWQRSLGGSGDDIAHSVQQTTDGGYIVAGYSNSNDGDLTTNYGGSDYWVVKLNSTGNIIWQRSIGGSDQDNAFSIHQTAQGDYIVAGRSYSNDGYVIGNHGSSDYWIVALDSVGNVSWQKALGGSTYDAAHSIQSTVDGGYLIGGVSDSDDGDVIGNIGGHDYWIVKLNASGNISWQKSLGGTSYDGAECIQQTAEGDYILAGISTSSDGHITGHHGAEDYWIIKIKSFNITSAVFLDLDQNCIKDTNETGIDGINLVINPGSIAVTTNASGQWGLDSLAIGTYTITIDTTQPNWVVTCPVTQTFTVVYPDSLTQAPEFGMVSAFPCNQPNISTVMPIMRRGFAGNIYVSACNENTATNIMDSAYCVVELPPDLTFNSASMPYTALGSNQFSFFLDTLYPGQCVNFTISAIVELTATAGQTLCVEALLYPQDSCVFDTIFTPYGTSPSGTVSPCTTAWDRSSLMVEGECIGDSVRFVIYNTGDPIDGDMDCFAPIRIYVDGAFITLDSIQLAGGDSIVFMFEGNGGTWTLEADQHPLHPGSSHPNAHVEDCGSGTWTPGVITQFPENDADPVVDIYCGQVTAPLDPNDKTGFPNGFTGAHYIQQNQQLEYLIRFQNVGTDTAFNVVIRDTLPTDLNLFTVTPQVASHPNDFRMYGPGILEWTFSNIMLPDSNVNEPASHGFVKFTVDQVPDLPYGTVIENSAAIYFDFELPVITNTYFHTIHDFSIALSVDRIQSKPDFDAKLVPNPADEMTILQISGAENKEFDVFIYDLSGKAVNQITNQKTNNIPIQVSNLKAGVYLINVMQDGSILGMLKMLVQ